MGKFIDETGNKYHRLTVLYRGNNKNGRVQWHCRCDCGKELDVDGSSLRNGNTKSCGCLQKEKASKTLKDLTGEKFGKLTVLNRDETKPKGHGKPVFWNCVCECGRIISVEGSHLKNGHTKSCGCYNINAQKVIDETGNKYGMLTVINRCGTSLDGRALWLCLCDCGNEKIALGKSLRTGSVISCGCIHSKGEFKISNLLKELNIDFIPQYHIDELKNEQGYHLYFDFFLPKYNIVIEYQGEQHYHPLDYYIFNKEKYEVLKSNDNLKKQFCIKNKIKLIEIPYTDYNKLSVSYLKEMIE